MENRSTHSLGNAGVDSSIPIRNKRGFSKAAFGNPVWLLGSSHTAKKGFSSNDEEILNTNSQFIIKSIFLYKIGVERERIVAIPWKQNIFSFLLLLPPGFEPLNLAGRDGSPLLLDVSWENGSSTSGGGQQLDLRVGCPRRALGSAGQGD